MFKNADGKVVLQGDGSYGWGAIVDGDDLVVRNVRATWFGGDSDPLDNGETASGVNTKGHPNLDGCALPMTGMHVPNTEGSPLPKVPWKTIVRVYNRDNHKVMEIPVIDLGPAKPPHAHAALDLTIHAFKALGGSLNVGELHVDYRVIGGATYLDKNTKEAIKKLLAD